MIHDINTVGINTLFIQPGRNAGTETYIHELLNEFANAKDVKFILFTSESNDSSFQNGENVKKCKTEISGRSRIARVCYEQIRLNRDAVNCSCNVLFCPGYIAPIFQSLPTVVTIHDTQFRDVNQIPLGIKIAYNCIVPIAAKRSQCVLTISEYSKSRIHQNLHITNDKIHVTLLGAKQFSDFKNEKNEGLILRQYGIRKPYILSVSSGLPHKNIIGLVHGFRMHCKGTQSPAQMVFVGNKPLNNKIIKQCNSSSNIVFTGYIPDSHLRVVYRNAHCFALASFYEGFGLPILEAMSFGIPVACSNAASLPEIGGQAAVYFDPHSTDQISLALNKLYDDELRNKLKIAGFDNLKRFSWRKCSELTLRILKSAFKAAS